MHVNGHKVLRAFVWVLRALVFHKHGIDAHDCNAVPMKARVLNDLDTMSRRVLRGWFAPQLYNTVVPYEVDNDHEYDDEQLEDAWYEVNGHS